MPLPDHIIAPPINEQPGAKPHYGRLKLTDTRSFSYPLGAKLEEVKQPSRTKRQWRPRWQGDQGNFPYCTAYTALHWWEMEPVAHPRSRGKWKKHPYPLVQPRQWYCEAQGIDPWPGGCGSNYNQDAYDGTSLTAMLKVMKNHGLVSEYTWEYHDVDNVVKAILHVGPVMIGVDWYDGMTLPRAHGPYDSETAILRASGRLVGGHATLLSGVDLTRKRRGKELTVFNSWGPGWGDRGKAYMSLDTLEFLMKRDGEVALATEVE